jgi:hypothetical protein
LLQRGRSIASGLLMKVGEMISAVEAEHREGRGARSTSRPAGDSAKRYFSAERHLILFSYSGRATQEKLSLWREAFGA